MRLAIFGRFPVIQFSKQSRQASWPALQGALAAFVLILMSLPGAAQSPRIKNIELCNGADRTSPDPQIAGCTALIESGNETPAILTVAFNNRGNAYTNKGDYDRAIEDYGRSIALDPNFVRAFNNRGVAYRRKGDFDRALADFNKSIKLKSEIRQRIRQSGRNVPEAGPIRSRRHRFRRGDKAPARFGRGVEWALLDASNSGPAASRVVGLRKGGPDRAQCCCVQFARLGVSEAGRLRAGHSGLQFVSATGSEPGNRPVWKGTRQAQGRR